MKKHLLAALREIRDQWETLFAQLDEAQLNAPMAPSHWSAKDVLTHLWAWQQRTIARVEAAQHNREPVFPSWGGEGDPDTPDNVNAANAFTYDTYHVQPWPVIHEMWRAGFQHLLDLADALPERDLLDTGRYVWLNGYSIAFILIATYDHHQEHLEKMQAWLQDHAPNNG